MKVTMWPWSHPHGHELEDGTTENKTMVLFVRFKILLVSRPGFTNHHLQCVACNPERHLMLAGPTWEQPVGHQHRLSEVKATTLASRLPPGTS